MNTIMVTMLKVLFPYGLSLSYILIHSIIFRNWPTNVSNSSKGVSIPCHVPPLPPKRGLGATVPMYYHLFLSCWNLGLLMLLEM